MDTLVGDIGKFKTGYQTAATVAGWTVTRQQDTLGAPTVRLTALIRQAHPFYSNQRPLILGLWMGKVWWVWRTINVEAIELGTITAQLIGDPVAVVDF